MFEKLISKYFIFQCIKLHRREPFQARFYNFTKFANTRWLFNFNFSTNIIENTFNRAIQTMHKIIFGSHLPFPGGSETRARVAGNKSKQSDDEKRKPANNREAM